MITRFTISNFKRLETATIELGNAVVFIGPNNSGKTSALQAMTLWDVGWRRWTEKRDESAASERKGVTINRRDLYPIPIPSARLLWNDLHTQDTKMGGGKQRTFKRDYHGLADAIPTDEIAPEVSTVLDAILEAANRAKPAV